MSSVFSTRLYIATSDSLICFYNTSLSFFSSHCHPAGGETSGKTNPFIRCVLLDDAGIGEESVVIF